jgi:hypothetical protein
VPGKKAPPALTPQQQRAASLVGRGLTKKEAAAEAGVSARTMTNWSKREDFQALAQQHRDQVLSETPTAKATLEAALTATKRDGSPDWQTRVSAARALVTAKGASAGGEPEPPRETSFNEAAFEEPEPETEAKDVSPAAAYAAWDEAGRPEPTPEEQAEWWRLTSGDPKGAGQ